MTGIYIVGAGGLGREVLSYAEQLAASDDGPEVLGFLDDDGGALAGFALGVSVVAPTYAEEYLAQSVVIALGDPGLRRSLRIAVEAAGGTLHSVIHPQAWVAADAQLEPGCIVAPYAFVGTGAQVASNVVINTMVSIGHDSQIGADSVLSPHVGISGHCQVGDRVLCGTHAAIVPRCEVGEGARLAAGAVVTRNVPDNALAVGNPAKSRVLFSD